ncbi:MAG: histidine kinase N-terminal 7TM domain-containing protein, partial [bacterium]
MNIYSIISLIASISAFFLAITVLVKNRKSRLNQVFSLFIFSVVIWLFASFLMFISATDKNAIFWDRIVYSGLAFTPVFLYHFILLFTENEKKQKHILYTGYIFSFIFLVLSWTKYFIDGLYRYSWGVHTQAKGFHSLFLVFFAIYITITFFNIYLFRKRAIGIQRNQTNYIFLALLIIVITAFGFLPAYGIDIIVPFPYFAAFICVLVLFFAIARYHLMNIHVITGEIFGLVLWVTLLIKIFFSNSLQDLIINISVFATVIFFGVLLIRSVIREVRQRERMEKMAKDLEVAFKGEKSAKEKIDAIRVEDEALLGSIGDGVVA